MYNQKIINIFKNPTNAGGLHGANGIGKIESDITGYVTKIYLKINDDKIIEEARFKTKGSVISIVATSVICNLVVNKNIENVTTITEKDILEVLGTVPQEKQVYLTQVVETLKGAVCDYHKRLAKELKNKENK